jgi:site-specific recombinase XerD
LKTDAPTPRPAPAQDKLLRTASDLEFADAFLASIASSEQTVETYRYGLALLAEFIAATRYIPPPRPYPASRLRDDVLLKFHEWLQTAKQKPRPGRREKSYSAATRNSYLAAVRRFLIWLDANDRLPAGFQVGKAINRLKAATGRKRSPRIAHRPDPGVPRIVAYYDDIPLPSPDEPRGRQKRLEILRNRAIAHTLYASAGRVSEVARLTRKMVLDGRLREVPIEGKGKKERVLLLTKEAQQAIAAYCRERDDDSLYLFVSHGPRGSDHLSRNRIWRVVKDAAQALGLAKTTSPHAFRHYRAQQLLAEGMELDVLQAYLGHANIATTRDIYAPYTALEKVKDQLDTYGRSAREVSADEPR